MLLRSLQQIQLPAKCHETLEGIPGLGPRGTIAHVAGTLARAPLRTGRGFAARGPSLCRGLIGRVTELQGLKSGAHDTHLQAKPVTDARRGAGPGKVFSRNGGDGSECRTRR